MDFGILPEILFWGLYAGSIYILLAIGLNLIFGVMKVVNFAHGELLMLSIYITFLLHSVLGLNPYLIVPITMVLMFFIGVLIERVCFRPIMGTGKLNEIFMSLALIYLIQNGVALVWGNDYNTIHSPLGNSKLVIAFDNSLIVDVIDIQSTSLKQYNASWMMSLSLDHVVIISVTVFLLLMFYLFMWKTKTGKAMRATSQNREAAMLAGINVERMDMISFGLGASFAAAASLWWITGLQFNPYVGSIPAIKAFAVIIFGGLGSIQGAIAGGLIYGIAENASSYVFGGAWKDATSFIILVLMLVLRPTGLFGEGED